MKAKNLTRVKKLEQAPGNLTPEEEEFLKIYRNSPSPDRQMTMKALVIMSKNEDMLEILKRIHANRKKGAT